MTEGPFEYAAFLSYNSADRAIARRLQRTLESYAPPAELRGQATSIGIIGDRLGRICRDRTDFRSGESLSAALKAALDKSSALIVLCSPDSAQSKWVNEEVAYFRSIGRGARIFPLIARTDETGSILNSFPPALRREDGDEAIAADLRKTGDGWQDGVLKIIASVLDVEFDAVRRRALESARRRARVAFALAGGMSLLALVAVMSSATALLQRNRALENFEDAIVISARSASRINQLTDETQVPRALIHEFLAATEEDLKDLSSLDAMQDHPRVRRIAVEYELLLSDAYAEAGRTAEQLAAAQSANRAMALIARDAKAPWRRFRDATLYGEVNAEYLAAELSAEVAQSLGAALLANGALERARDAFQSCEAQNRALIDDWELEPEERVRFADDALRCAAQGADVAASLNQPGIAMIGLQKALADFPDEALGANAFANLVLARIQADNGNLKDAIFRLDREIARASGAEGRQQQIALAELLTTRARALEWSGRISDAMRDIEDAERRLQSFLESDANDRRVGLVRSGVAAARGEMTARAGDRAAAARQFEAARANLDRLVAFDPDRRDWRIARADVHLALSDNALRQFETGGAPISVAVAHARDALADLARTPPSRADAIAIRRRVLANIALARALRLSGAPAEATLRLAAAEDALTGIAGRPAGRAPFFDALFALIADERGDIAATAGRRAEAGRHYERSIALQRAFIAQEPAASLAIRDLLWTELSHARNLIAGGDREAAQLAIAEACALKRNKALSEYSLFVRDGEAVSETARALQVAC
jgi:tetratricopeptide (TPR) repeat protein